jgi:hypothetical protein
VRSRSGLFIPRCWFGPPTAWTKLRESAGCMPVMTRVRHRRAPVCAMPRRPRTVPGRWKAT